MTPGEIIYGDGAIAINEGAQRLSMDVVNTGDRPVQVGSHVHFPQANAALEFDRADALVTASTFRQALLSASNPVSRSMYRWFR